MEGYTIIHIGNGKFKAKMTNGDVKDVGSSLCGMIKYTYFEDTEELPEIGWKITSNKLMEDYFPKIQRDIFSGKIKP
jgi:hypothetical protein